MHFITIKSGKYGKMPYGGSDVYRIDRRRTPGRRNRLQIQAMTRIGFDLPSYPEPDTRDQDLPIRSRRLIETCCIPSEDQTRGELPCPCHRMRAEMSDCALLLTVVHIHLRQKSGFRLSHCGMKGICAFTIERFASCRPVSRTFQI